MPRNVNGYSYVFVRCMGISIRDYNRRRSYIGLNVRYPVIYGSLVKTDFRKEPQYNHCERALDEYHSIPTWPIKQPTFDQYRRWIFHKPGWYRVVFEVWWGKRFRSKKDLGLGLKVF